VSRISRISSAEDFVAEARREALRDWRWRRYRSMIFALALLSLAIASLASSLPDLLPTVLRLL
jgi:hypothetical protein